jgi:hypothetical protein
VLFASGAITFYESNNMLSALAKYVINRLIHGLFHTVNGRRTDNIMANRGD